MDLYDFLCWMLVIYILYKVCDFCVRIPYIGKYDSRHILVTGCDSGFGYEIARKLDARGCHVFAACLTEKGEDNLRKICSSRLKAFHMDVTKSESIKKGYNFVEENLPKGKGLWGILNNAGVAGLIGPAEWLTKKNYQDVLDVNLLGLVDNTINFLHLVKKEKGRIVNTASMLGRAAPAGSSPYCVSKYGVEAFSDCIRRQLRPYKVSVHIIEPGFFHTSMGDVERIKRSVKESWSQCSPEIKHEYGQDFVENYIPDKTFSLIVSERIHVVVDAYEHALLGSFPRARYLLGLDARLFMIPVQSLPEWLGDWLHDKLSPDRPLPEALKH